MYNISQPDSGAITHSSADSAKYIFTCADLQIPRWYAVHTRSRHEKRISQQLQDRSIECFLPVYESIHRWNDRKAVVSAPLFPGYLFVRTALAQCMQVVSVQGIVNLVGIRGRPTPIPDEEVTALRDCFARRVGMEPHPYLAAGRRVRIKNGPLAEMEGILIRRKGRFRLVLSVNLIARSVAIEVDANDVRAC